MRNAIANGKSFLKRSVLSLLGFEMKSISGFEAFLIWVTDVKASTQNSGLKPFELRSAC